MLLFVVSVIAAGLGAIVRYTLPGRESYGSVLVPAVAAVVTGTVWVGLVWLGWTFDAGWIWLVSLLAGTVAALATAALLPRARRDSDAQLLRELSGGRA